MPRFVTDSRPMISAQHPVIQFYREEFLKHQRCLQQQRPYYSESAITDVETALAAVARRDEIAAEEAAKQLAAQRAAETQALEEHRRNSWLNHRIDQCKEASDPNAAFVALLGRTDLFADTPEGVWPPNDGSENYRAAVAAVSVTPDPKVESTRLGAALKARLGSSFGV